jgi:shikimate kinase
MKIVLMGYMGSGKSAVARALSAKLKLNLIDLDSYFEKKNGPTCNNCSIVKPQCWCH